MIKKTMYEEFYRYHDFSLWLEEEEGISFADVKAYHEDNEQQDMLSDIGIYNQKLVRFRIKGGQAGKQYRVSIKIITTNGQKFEDILSMLVV